MAQRTMETFKSLTDLAEAGGPEFGLALGVFDGVHRGHQAVIDEARGLPRLGVLTFEPHPVEVLAPQKSHRRILSGIEHKKRILGELGVDFVVVIPFTREFAMAAAEEFAKDLFRTGVKRLSAGEDWTFGKERRGTMTLLGDLGEKEGIEVRAKSPVLMGGERVSSTRVRRLILDGELRGAADLLGRPYSVYGTVRRGKQLGRTIGFPTANVSVADELLPSNGVYLIESDGVKGVANVGLRPTVETSQRRSLEVHLFSDAVPDAYDWEIEVGFVEKIREEKKFTSLEELKAQIGADVEWARSRG